MLGLIKGDTRSLDYGSIGLERAKAQGASETQLGSEQGKVGVIGGAMWGPS